MDVVPEKVIGDIHMVVDGVVMTTLLVYICVNIYRTLQFQHVLHVLFFFTLLCFELLLIIVQQYLVSSCWHCQCSSTIPSFI